MHGVALESRACALLAVVDRGEVRRHVRLLIVLAEVADDGPAEHLDVLVGAATLGQRPNERQRPAREIRVPMLLHLLDELEPLLTAVRRLELGVILEQAEHHLRTNEHHVRITRLDDSLLEQPVEVLEYPPISGVLGFLPVAPPCTARCVVTCEQRTEQVALFAELRRQRVGLLDEKPHPGLADPHLSRSHHLPRGAVDMLHQKHDINSPRHIGVTSFCLDDLTQRPLPLTDHVPLLEPPAHNMRAWTHLFDYKKKGLYAQT